MVSSPSINDTPHPLKLKQGFSYLHPLQDRNDSLINFAIRYWEQFIEWSCQFLVTIPRMQVRISDLAGTGGPNSGRTYLRRHRAQRAQACSWSGRMSIMLINNRGLRWVAVRMVSKLVIQTQEVRSQEPQGARKRQT